MAKGQTSLMMIGVKGERKSGVLVEDLPPSVFYVLLISLFVPELVTAS